MHTALHRTAALRSRSRVASVAALGAALGLGATFYQYQRDEGFRRFCKFGRHCLPIFLHYRYVELTDNRSESFERLHRLYVRRVMDIVTDMKGYYIKLAQAGSQMHACPAVYSEVLGHTGQG